MSATNHTTNLSLSQFVNTDVPAWRQDYNGDMLKIDNAYTADISSATAETSADPSDYMKFYDVSATTNKKILISDLLKGAKVEDLTDTDITTPANNDGLVYDATAQKWENVPITTKEQWKKNGAYNLCPINNTSQVIEGVTWTVNSDGTVTANCSSNNHAKSIFWLWINSDYKVSYPYVVRVLGAPSGASSNTYHIGGVGVGVAYTEKDIQANTAFNIALIVAENVVVDNIVFKPMITTDLNATYADYVPNAKTNSQLTEFTAETNYASSITSAHASITYQASSSVAIKTGNIVYLCLAFTVSDTVPAYTKLLSLPSALQSSRNVDRIPMTVQNSNQAVCNPASGSLGIYTSHNSWTAQAGTWYITCTYVI